MGLDALWQATSTWDRLGKKRTKYLKDAPEAQLRRNRIRAIAASIADVPQNGLCKLPLAVRNRAREQATNLYDLGHTVPLQTLAEKSVTAGFVYVVCNKAFPDHVKIGRAFEPESRLAAYQTGCPYRGYAMFHFVYFEDCLSAERNIHDALSCLRERGEWYRLTAWQAMEVINQYKETYPCGQRS